MPAGSDGAAILVKFGTSFQYLILNNFPLSSVFSWVFLCNMMNTWIVSARAERAAAREMATEALEEAEGAVRRAKATLNALE